MTYVKTMRLLAAAAGCAIAATAAGSDRIEFQTADYGLEGSVSDAFNFENGVRLSASDGMTGDPSAATRGGTPGEGDLAWCELYDLFQFGRTGDTVGLSIATTSYNVGDGDLMWFANPNPNHPYIVSNLYRLADGRLTQVGQSWCKHGFYALGNSQCTGNCSFEPGHSQGNWLGQRCTDTYWSALNADQSGLGPRFEIDPWAGTYSYQGSFLQTGGGPPTNGGAYRRLQVKDADLDPSLNPGADYFIEGYYVLSDDSRNIVNNFAHKEVNGVSGTSGGNYQFNVSGFNDTPLYGPAIFRWPGFSTLIAEEIPVVKGVSPDGRAFLKTNNSDNGDGTYHYEFMIFNVDMDRQIDSFTLPLPAGVTVTDAGFHAPFHHDEPTAWVGGPAIDNAAWDITINADSITWTTTTNPIRWGTLYNFWFDADAEPGTVTADIGMFRPGTPESLSGSTIGPATPVGPTVCPGDADGNNAVDFDDINLVLLNWGTAGPDGDIAPSGGDGAVNFDDLNDVLTNWGATCP